MKSQERIAKGYESLLSDFEEDPNVIGFILGGSRSKGLATEYSDYDCTAAVKEGMVERYQAKYTTLPEGIDIEVYSLSGLRTAFRWGGSLEWGITRDY